jgi:predicted GNAT family N-acyltransferase
MVDSNLKIRQINFSDKEFLNIKKIRKSIFSDVMGISELELFDKFDETSDHFLFLYQNSVIGSVRLRQIENNIKLERMAIYTEFRNQNFGYDAIRQIIDHYRERKIEKIILDSIYDVKDFYKKCGFTEVSQIFDRVGLPHITMELLF